MHSYLTRSDVNKSMMRRTWDSGAVEAVELLSTGRTMKTLLGEFLVETLAMSDSGKSARGLDGGWGC